MAQLLVNPGTKMQAAFDVPLGQSPDFNMMVTFQKALDDAFFLVSVPMLAGKALILDENQKMLFQYGEGDQNFIIAGYPEALEKVGVRSYWKIRQVAEQRTFFQRRDERYKVQMQVGYVRDYVENKELEDAMSIDISAGGMAIYLNDWPDVGEALDVKLPGITIGEETFTVPYQLGIVCWVREAPKGALYRNTCGLQFRYADDVEREEVREYIEHVRAKYKV